MIEHFRKAQNSQSTARMGTVFKHERPPRRAKNFAVVDVPDVHKVEDLSGVQDALDRGTNLVIRACGM